MTGVAREAQRPEPQESSFASLGDALAGAIQSWADECRDGDPLRQPGPADAERLGSLLLLQAVLSRPQTERVPA